MPQLEQDAVDDDQILVVIPTLNEAKFIEQTLDALIASGKGLQNARVVVADGGSTDGTRALVATYGSRHPNVVLMDNPGRRQSAGINLAVETQALPQHAYLVRCDAHADYPPNYIRDVVSALRTQGADALATVMDSGGESCFQKGAAWAVDTKLGSGGSGHRGGATSGWVDHGHHAGFTLDIWRKTGGYAADFAANEDAELDHRIAKAGGRIWLEAGIRMGYHMRPSLQGLAKQYWRYGRGRAQTVFRHRIRPRLRQVIPALAFLGNLGAVVLSPLVPALLLIPAFYLLVLAAQTVALLRREGSPCALWAGPALFAMHMFWGAGFVWHALTRRGASA